VYFFISDLYFLIIVNLKTLLIFAPSKKRQTQHHNLTQRRIKTQIMKKAFFGLVLGLTAFTANAQTQGTATLNVKLNPIQTLMVNPANNVVTLEYKNKADYANGVSAKQENHLTVYSTGGFQVYAKSSQQNLTGGPKDIAATQIKLTASAGKTNPRSATGSPEYKSVDLVHSGDKGVMLVKSTEGGVDRNIDVTYAAKGDDAFINHVGQAAATYTTTVVYEIVAM